MKEHKKLLETGVKSDLAFCLGSHNKKTNRQVNSLFVPGHLNIVVVKKGKSNNFEIVLATTPDVGLFPKARSLLTFLLLLLALPVVVFLVVSLRRLLWKRPHFHWEGDPLVGVIGG